MDGLLHKLVKLEVPAEVVQVQHKVAVVLLNQDNQEIPVLMDLVTQVQLQMEMAAQEVAEQVAVVMLTAKQEVQAVQVEHTRLQVHQ